MSVTTYGVDDEGVALLRLDRPEARNAINTQMLEELVGHLAAARDDDAVRVLVLSSTDQMGLSAGADIREELDEAGAVRRMELFARLYDEPYADSSAIVFTGSCGATTTTSGEVLTIETVVSCLNRS